MTSTTMKLLPLACLCLLTRSGTTFADEHGSVIIIMKEDRDVILPCSFSTKDDIENKLFEWRKDGQNSVFRYDAGLHSNNGHPGQYEQFKGRVSYFEDERKYGNISIIIRNTTVADSGNYTCYSPRFMPQPVHIQLVFGPVIVKEGSDAILPCSYSTKDAVEKHFNWKKDGQKVVFMYGRSFPFGFPNQDEQFEGRVSHFPNLKYGNASILISNTKVTDSGIYTCDFPLWSRQLVHVQLVVGKCFH
ncbi:CD276 antigen homolog [Micropterus salmoides]|uniref:CD276 antigen homolog n=1 Tax=Micropterus salmoides TaxID=27706 RepID=UPI0018EC6197|nr:CD276 antigen homolog [Micropterus salmoides]